MERRYADRQDYDLMKAQVEAIVKAAVEVQCSVLVLSAFGGGAFENPPDQVVHFFDEALKHVGMETYLEEV
eukprot:10614862-Alexandrium_andersonii.AAC.1